MLQELLEKQRTYTDHFFNEIDLHYVEKIVDCLIGCQGVLFFTGVGKSGLVAKKIALTMVSTGTKAFFLSPTDALHGDLGMVSERDIFIIFSKSGESDELVQLAPAIKKKGAKIIGITCNPSSRLALTCDMSLSLPFRQELCPFDMAPTTSTTTQLLLGDLLTVALMRQKKFTIDQYALNHPSGRIGKRMLLKVKDIMLTESRIPLCKSKGSLQDALIELSNKRCGCLLVTDENLQLLGIFTDGDLRRQLQKEGGRILERKMQEIMNPSPMSIGPDILAWDAMKQMEANINKRLMVLPVVDDQSKILGILHLHDLVQSGL